MPDALDVMNESKPIPEKVPDMLLKMEGGAMKTIWVQCNVIIPPDYDPANLDSKLGIRIQHAYFGDITLPDVQTMCAELAKFLAMLVTGEEAKNKPAICSESLGLQNQGVKAEAEEAKGGIHSAE